MIYSKYIYEKVSFKLYHAKLHIQLKCMCEHKISDDDYFISDLFF
jgi:hypothetical protein